MLYKVCKFFQYILNVFCNFLYNFDVIFKLSKAGFPKLECLHLKWLFSAPLVNQVIAFTAQLLAKGKNNQN